MGVGDAITLQLFFFEIVPQMVVLKVKCFILLCYHFSLLFLTVLLRLGTSAAFLNQTTNCFCFVPPTLPPAASS